MVCTDAAARGIDIPHVTHVVQSSFAASAVDFLHRVSSYVSLDPLEDIVQSGQRPVYLLVYLLSALQCHLCQQICNSRHSVAKLQASVSKLA